MFIQNRAKSIAQRLNAKNIAPLRERIAEFADKIAESATFCHSKRCEESKKNNIVILSDSEESKKKSFCHIERSEISQKNNRDSSLRLRSAQNDKIEAENDNLVGIAESRVDSVNSLVLRVQIDDIICVDLVDSAPSQNLIKNNPRVSANLETRPLRGAKNRIQGRSSASADFLLEAEKRGSPPKSEKAAAFWETHLNVVGGSGNGGVQPFLREKTSEISGNGIAESNKNSPSLAEGARGWVNFIQVVDSTNIFSELKSLLKDLKPWRKGPFNFCGIEVQSEWDSAIKFNIIAPHLSVEGKVVADIGCNNGYYSFRLLPLRPSKIVGFEPSAHCKMQFDLINAFVKSEICFEMLGVEDLADYDCKFDCILCLGVIYHRTNPLDCLKILRGALNPRGELIIDTLIIEGEGENVLSPLSYAKMKNVYFIPSIRAFQNWLKRAGFKEIELLEIKKTTSIEQRKTAWSGGESLEDFLDKNDKNKTIEGYNAPTRAYFKAKI